MTEFYKIQASGNDFAVFLKKNFPVLPPERLESFIIRTCERKLAVGADGFILLDIKSPGHMSWDFYNSDASSAEMCGNAARAIMKLFVERLSGHKKASLDTLGGKVLLEYLGEQHIKVKMPKRELVFSSDEMRIWNTGVPHCVQEFDFSDLELARQKAISLRYPSALDERGANVSFWTREKEAYRSISFERGVEDFTLACGTGACASGLDILENSEQSEVELSLPGGIVRIEKIDTDVFLIGGAEIVFKGEIDL